MDDRQLEAFKALVGEDVAEATLSKAEAVNSKAMDPMAVYKSLDMSQLVLQLKGLAELKTRIGADEEAGVFSQAAGILEKDAAPEPEPTPSDEMDDVIKALLESGNDEAAGKLQRLKESLFADVASVKATDEEDDEEEDEEEVTETSKESNSISPSAVDAQLKEYADRLALVERAVRERDVSVTQRAASRPTRMVSNINKNATPLAEKERGESRSETIVAGMSNAMIETILGGGSPNG